MAGAAEASLYRRQQDGVQLLGLYNKLVKQLGSDFTEAPRPIA